MKIVFIACVSKKKNYATNAIDLYDSPLFKKEVEYAKSLKPDKIYILSALYGVLEKDEIISPYNVTLNDMKQRELDAWNDKVYKQLMEKNINFEKDHAIFLAGNRYRKKLLNIFLDVSVPMEGMRIGEQLAFLTEEIKNG